MISTYIGISSTWGGKLPAEKIFPAACSCSRRRRVHVSASSSLPIFHLLCLPVVLILTGISLYALSTMHQRYKSTRGGTAQDDYSFEEALFSGYAPDGGLFVPASLPSCREKEQYLRWSNMTFPALAYDVLVSMLAHESFVLLLDKLFQTTFVFTALRNSETSSRQQKLMMPI